jgi:hypothetical protein
MHIFNFLTSLRTILLISFGLSAVYAGYYNLRSIRKFRAPRNYTGELLSWVERPYTSFKYEPDTWIAINIHRLALFLTGCVCLYLLFVRPVTGLAIPGVPAYLGGLIVFAILGGCVSGMGFFWGQALFGPLAEFLGGDSHYAISDGGVLYGGQLFPWSTYSHYSLNPEGTVIQLWSASFPGAVAFTLTPPSAGEVSRLRGIVESHMPSGEADAPGFLRRCAFPALMAALAIIFIAAAVWSTSLSYAITMILIAVLMYLLVFLGGRVIMQLIYGGRNRPAPYE